MRSRFALYHDPLAENVTSPGWHHCEMVDIDALTLMTKEDLMSLGMKLGPALKLLQRVQEGMRETTTLGVVA